MAHSRSKHAGDSPENSPPSLSEDAYLDCFRRALRRMAVTLNLRPLNLRSVDLRSSDAELQHLVGDVKDRDLFRLRRVSMPGESTSDPDIAENFFYGWFEGLSVVPSGQRRWKPIYSLPDAFLEYSYQGLHMPRYSDEELGAEGLDRDELLAECATNYLLKNFWHNFVHNAFQNIDHTNHHEFGGTAQFESDFEADNWGTILLAYSYGLPIETRGFASLDERFFALLRRNRCNQVFAIRAKRRAKSGETAPSTASLSDFLDDEWRLRRAAANYIGGRLLASGRAVSDVGVYLTGRPSRAGESYRRKGAKIVVQINGLRLPTQYKGTRRAWERASLRDYSSEIAQWVDMKYSELLRERPHLREHAKAAIAQRLAMVRAS